MAIMERWIQKMTSEKAWSIQIESEKKWAAVEKEIGGFPTKRIYRPLAVPTPIGSGNFYEDSV